MASWRDVLKIHPAAELFPRMSEAELTALGEDIKVHGLRTPVVLWVPGSPDDYDDDDSDPPQYLLDGISRLDAMERADIQSIDDDPTDPFTNRFHACSRIRYEKRPLSIEEQSRKDKGEHVEPQPDTDPYAYVMSANIHRRHLDPEQKRELIAKLIKATPDKSDRQIAEMVKASPTTVGTVRAEMEATGDVSKLDTRTDSKGRLQRARKPRNPERAKINREMKLGTEIMEKIAGTSLATAREHDALIFLNRGAPEGGHTEDVKRLVADAVAGRCVSAVEWKNNGGPLCDDTGPDNTGEMAHKDVYIEELQAKINHLRRENAALRDRVAELEAQLLDIPGFLDRTKEAAS